VARREGKALVILHNGQTIMRLTPFAVLPDGLACDSIVLGKVLMLWDPDTKRREPVAAVMCCMGEFDNTLLVNWDGTAVRVRNPSASPNGRILVTGTDNAYGTAESSLMLHSWPDQAIIGRFTPGCRLTAWQNDNHFYARCQFDLTIRPDNAPFDPKLDNDTLYFYARAWYGVDGLWHMESAPYGLTEDPHEWLHAISSMSPVITNAASQTVGDIWFIATSPSNPAQQ